MPWAGRECWGGSLKDASVKKREKQFDPPITRCYVAVVNSTLDLLLSDALLLSRAAVGF